MHTSLYIWEVLNFQHSKKMSFQVWVIYLVWNYFMQARDLTQLSVLGFHCNVCLVFCQLKFDICVRCDMAFIEPMHRNKPNITYLLHLAVNTEKQSQIKGLNVTKTSKISYDVSCNIMSCDIILHYYWIWIHIIKQIQLQNKYLKSKHWCVNTVETPSSMTV